MVPGGHKGGKVYKTEEKYCVPWPSTAMCTSFIRSRQLPRYILHCYYYFKHRGR